MNLSHLRRFVRAASASVEQVGGAPAHRPAFADIRRLTGVAGAALTLAVTTSGQTITSIGVLRADDHYSAGLAISADGRVVAGASAADFFSDTHGIRWTRQTGMRDIGALPDTSNTFGQGVSADGCVIVGAAYGELETAYRWTAAGGMENLGTLPNAMYGASAAGVSGDGNKVCGTSSSADGQPHAFIWTRARGMEDCGLLPGGSYVFGTAISANGTSITGIAGTGDSEVAFRWTRARGMQPLPQLNAGEPAGGFAINADGGVIAGYAGAYAVLWRGDSVRNLGTVSGGTFSTAYSVSGDGRMVGGIADNADGEIVAMIWTESLGMVELYDYLVQSGVDMSEWSQLEVAAAISTDGSTIAGIGWDNDNNERGFVLKIGDCRGPRGGCRPGGHHNHGRRHDGRNGGRWGHGVPNCNPPRHH